MKIVKPSVELLEIAGGEKLIEQAGRTCYKSGDSIGKGTSEPFAKRLIGMGHESVIEHSFASFRIVCDRGVSHELVRHRLCSFSQESTRYCNYGSGKFGSEISVIEPPGLSPEKRDVWIKLCEIAEGTYMALIELGASPQIARSVLPTCLKTELVMSTNFREWRHIIKLRTSPKAHPQMREIACQIRDILIEKEPACFGDLKCCP